MRIAELEGNDRECCKESDNRLKERRNTGYRLLIDRVTFTQEAINSVDTWMSFLGSEILSCNSN
jgi:hypothetical protein